MKDEVMLKQLGERIKATRKAAKLSRDELAAIADVDRKTIMGIENFKTSPLFVSVWRLLMALKIPPNDIIPFEKSTKEKGASE